MRGEKIKVTLSLNAEALRLLDSLVTERKRGEFVSGLILAHAARRESSAELTRSLTDTAQQGVAQHKAVELAERLRELALQVGALRVM